MQTNDESRTTRLRFYPCVGACCKRDAMIAFKNAVEYINTHYDVQLDYEKQACEFSDTNLQCIKERCTFYTGI